MANSPHSRQMIPWPVSGVRAGLMEVCSLDEAGWESDEAQEHRAARPPPVGGMARPREPNPTIPHAETRPNPGYRFWHRGAPIRNRRRREAHLFLEPKWVR